MPSPAHWRQAIADWGTDPVAGGIELETNLDWIECRANAYAEGRMLITTLVMDEKKWEPLESPMAGVASGNSPG